MGAIQNSINQMINTTTVAAGLGKHLSEQKKSNELALAKAKESAIENYAKNSEEAINLINEEKGLKAEAKDIKKDENLVKANDILANHEEGANFKASELIRDSEGNMYTPNEYIDKANLALKEVKNKQEAIKYQKFKLAERMKVQDEQWGLLGIDKKKDLGMLNSPKDQKAIHKMKEDYQKAKDKGGNK